MQSIQKQKKFRSGFTLVEMLVYLAITVLISTILVQSIVIVFESNRSSFVDSNMRNSAYAAMEEITQQTRAAQSIDYAHSVFYPSTSGVLQLNEVDANNNASVVKFSVSGSSTLDFSLGSTTPSLVGPISLNGTQVQKLIFTPINTGNSSAVRIQLTLSATVAGITKVDTFYSTAILRGSY